MLADTLEFLLTLSKSVSKDLSEHRRSPQTDFLLSHLRFAFDATITITSRRRRRGNIERKGLAQYGILFIVLSMIGDGTRRATDQATKVLAIVLVRAKFRRWGLEHAGGDLSDAIPEHGMATAGGGRPR